MSYIIRYEGKKKSYFLGWSAGLIPMFGALKPDAKTYRTKMEALNQIRTMPVTAALMCEIEATP